MDDHGESERLSAGLSGELTPFGQGSLLEVRLNPRDVVSVPTDCSAQKLRCCRYTVVGTISDPYPQPVLGAEYDEFDDLYADEYDVWGEQDWEDDLLDW